MPLTRETCAERDRADPLSAARARFVLPSGVIYLDGNSLGATPKGVAERVTKTIEQEWGTGLIRSWNEAGWYESPGRIGAKLAPLLGAAPHQVTVTDTISVNLFKLLVAAARMRPGRKTIVAERGNFPSDNHIVESVARMMGLTPRFVPAAEIAAAIECEHGGLFERGRIVGGSGVRQVMLQDNDAAIVKLGPELQVKVRFGNGANYRHGVHLLGLRPGQLQTGGDGMLGHFVEAAPVGAAPDQLRFFDGGCKFAVLEYRGRQASGRPPLIPVVVGVVPMSLVRGFDGGGQVPLHRPALAADDDQEHQRADHREADDQQHRRLAGDAPGRTPQGPLRIGRHNFPSW